MWSRLFNSLSEQWLVFEKLIKITNTLQINLLIMLFVGLFVRVLDTLDRIICKACPFIAGGILVGSVYWTAVTYGAVTIMQILGHKEGLNVMEKADPLIMLIGLPTIPVMLMLGRLIRWEDALLKFWRKYSTKLPLLNLIFPNGKLFD
jgi:E3 ubiquitin-protein ligase MARCH5